MDSPDTTRHCRTPREISPEDAAEFRGLFFGEGHLDLCRQSALATLHPRARLAVRDDDRAVVEWCVALLGGNLGHRAATRSITWQLTGKQNIAALLDVLDGGTCPSKKRAEIVLMREANSLVVGRGGWPRATDAARSRLVAIRDELKSLREYRAGAAA